MAKIVKLAITDLKLNHFVRSRLNQEWAITLGELIENGVKLPPIKINKKNEVIDGRHRIEAHELNNLTEIECEVADVADEVELIAMAYRENAGGSLPPTKADTEHTIRLLLAHGETQKCIAERLALPIGIARKLCAGVRSKDERAKVMRAVDAVTNGGLSIPKAAEQHGADEDKLREALGGRGRRHKKGVEEMQRSLTVLFKSSSSKLAALMRGLFDKYEDGDVTLLQATDIINHLKNLQKRSARNVADWEKRFGASTSAGTGKKKAPTHDQPQA